MQDIVDECGISRGGIYIYYASVDEIFLDVIKRRNKERFSVINKAVQDAETFEDVLSVYLARQKSRLLNFGGSLFRAYCEYVFSKPKVAVGAFRDVQLGHLRKTIASVLRLGVQQGKIKNGSVNKITDHFIIVIDGLSVMALADAITEEIINEQFGILKNTIQGKLC